MGQFCDRFAWKCSHTFENKLKNMKRLLKKYFAKFTNIFKFKLKKNKSFQQEIEIVCRFLARNFCIQCRIAVVPQSGFSLWKIWYSIFPGGGSYYIIVFPIVKFLPHVFVSDFRKIINGSTLGIKINVCISIGCIPLYRFEFRCVDSVKYLINYQI